MEHEIGRRRCLKGTGTKIPDKLVPLNIDTCTDTDCIMRDNKKDRNKSSHCGSRTIALPSAESELHSICTAAQESPYVCNFIKEAFVARTNTRMHTNSSAGKSIH